jgi:hypothetical protein
MKTLAAKLSPSKVPVVDDQSNNTVPVDDALMPDIYAVEPATSKPGPKILDPSSPDIDKSTGFNPYDTAVLRKK